MGVEVKNLHIEYPDQLVFDDVNLSVSDDQIVAVHTEVLDGGTSLLKGIAGFLRGVNGEVWFEGCNLLEETPAEILFRLGYVYEDHGLVSIYSVFQNISLPMQFHTQLPNVEISEMVHEVCEFLAISESQYELRPHQLNDVQTRMVNLARALIVKPKLLLIDELEGGMPEDYLRDTMQALKDRQAKYPMAIIMATSSDIVKERADRVYSIENYNLVAA